MASEWAYAIARDQRRDVETMATNLDAARAQGRREGLKEAARIAARASDGGDECCCEKCLTACLIESEIRAAIAKEPTA